MGPYASRLVEVRYRWTQVGATAPWHQRTTGPGGKRLGIFRFTSCLISDYYKEPPYTEVFSPKDRENSVDCN